MDETESEILNILNTLYLDNYRSVEEVIKDRLQQREDTDACYDGDHKGAGILIWGGLPLLQTCECPGVVTPLHLVDYKRIRLK